MPYLLAMPVLVLHENTKVDRTMIFHLKDTVILTDRILLHHFLRDIIGRRLLQESEVLSPGEFQQS